MPSFPSIFDFFVGGIAGAVSKTIVAPLERIRLLMQTSVQNKKAKVQFEGVFNSLSRITRQQGILSLWRSNFINILRYSLTQAFAFMFKEYINQKIIQNHILTNKELLKNILAGGIAGSLSALIVYPLDYSRTRIAVDLGKKIEQRQFTSLMDCLRKTVHNDGFKGLFVGWQISIVSFFLYRGLYFGIFDTGKQSIQLLVKKILKRNQPEKNNSQKSLHFIQVLVKFCWAQFSVVFAQIIAYPADTIKRKMMMQTLCSYKNYSNTMNCIKAVLQNYGILQFWKGFTANIMTGFGTSICLILYDEIQKNFKRESKEY